MNWTEICIHTSQDAIEVISNILHEAGSNGVVIEDPKDLVNVWDTSFGEVYELNPDDYPETGVNIKGYFPSEEDLDKKIAFIKKNVEQLPNDGIDFGEKTIKIKHIHEENWASSWKQYYKPTTVSEKITICPTWETYEPKNSDEMVIELDPGMAFGTGTHQTTTLCIQALEKRIKQGDIVFDVGTGTGILSIAAALLGAGKVFAYDLDSVAVQSAKENIRINNLQKKITVERNNLLDDINQSADLIVANLLANIVIQFAKDVPNALKKNGVLIASGIIKSQQTSVEEALISQGLAIEEVMEKDDWIAIIARNAVK